MTINILEVKRLVRTGKMTQKQADALIEAKIVNKKGRGKPIHMKTKSGKDIKVFLVFQGLRNEEITEEMLELKERFYSLAVEVKNKHKGKDKQ